MMLQSDSSDESTSQEVKKEKPVQKEGGWLKFYWFAMFRNMSGAIQLVVGVVTASI